ncbi:hypothetical protein [Streptomyces sp. NPDC001889]
MQGEPTRSADTGDDGARTRRGPRHAAPRKSLLAKLQRPAGKAIALAAMPTAVLVGMGLTPRLALAEDKDIPYAPGPCVTRSDEPSAPASPPDSAKPSQSPSPSPSATPTASPPAPTPGEPSGGPSGEPSGGPTAAGEPEPAGSPSASRSGGAGPEHPARDPAPGRPGAASAAPARSPSAAGAEPGGERPRDPLDPGEALGEILGRPGGQPPPASSPSTAPATGKPPGKPAPSPSRNPSGSPSPSPSAKPSAASSGRPGTDEAAEKTRKAIEDAAGAAGATVEELPEEARGTEPRKDEAIPEGAKPRFPCPTPDPQALADARAEPGIPLVPDDPWVLESSLLTLTGLDYHGIVEVTTGGGKVKKALKFTARAVDIKDLHQLVRGPIGTTIHVEARKGSTSTIRDSTVTMYTEELKGNLFGLIPVTFSPRTPPPVNVPFAFFTDVRVVQAGQFGGTLTVPGLSNHLTGGDAGR